MGKNICRIEAIRSQLADADGVISLGEAIASFVADEIMMEIFWRWEVEKRLQKSMDMGACFKVDAAGYKRDAVKGVINHH